MQRILTVKLANFLPVSQIIPKKKKSEQQYIYIFIYLFFFRSKLLDVARGLAHYWFFQQMQVLGKYTDP